MVLFIQYSFRFSHYLQNKGGISKRKGEKKKQERENKKHKEKNSETKTCGQEKLGGKEGDKDRGIMKKSRLAVLDQKPDPREL